MHLPSTFVTRTTPDELARCSSRPNSLLARHKQKCKVSFSRQHDNSHSKSFVIAHPLTAKPQQDNVHQHQDSSRWWQQQQQHPNSSSSAVTSWASSFVGGSDAEQHAVSMHDARRHWQQQQQQHRRAAASSSRDSWLRRVWPYNWRPSTSSGTTAQGDGPSWLTAAAEATPCHDAQQQQQPAGGHGMLIAPSATYSMGASSSSSSMSECSVGGRSALGCHSSSDSSSSGAGSTTVVVFDSNHVTYSYSSFDDAGSTTHSSTSYSSTIFSNVHQASSASALSADDAVEIGSSSSRTTLQEQQQLQLQHGRLSTPIATQPAAAGTQHTSTVTQHLGANDTQTLNPAATVLAQHFSAAAAAAAAAAASPASSSGRLAGKSVQRKSSSCSSTSNMSNSYSSANAAAAAEDDSDWLTAVLAVPTSKLSVHSNAVLTNSLKRLASLRLGSSSSSAGAAVAVEGAEGLADLLGSVRSRFTTFGLQHFEEVALQLGQLGYQPDEEWLAAFERHSLAVLPGGSPRLLSRLLMARVKLSGSCSTAWCSALLAAMTAQPERLTVSSWVNALWSLVKVKHSPSRHFQETFFSSTASRLDDVSPELLTNLVWALARLQTAPSYLWWRSLMAATAAVEKAFSPGQLASLVHSIALWAEPGGIHARDVQRLLDLLLVEVYCQLAIMQPAELTTIIWSLGSLTGTGKFIPDWELQDHLLAAVQGQLPRLNHAQLTSLCWGLAKLDRGMPEGFAEALLLEVQAQVQGFADGNLATVLWALARLRLSPSGAFKQALWGDLQHRCSTLLLTDLSTIMWSLARLQLQPPADLLTEISQHALSAIRQTAPDNDAQDVAVPFANLICALGQLGSRPDRAWLEEVEQLSLQVLPSAGLPELVCLAKGMLRMVKGPLSETWQAAVLREVRLRCRCNGIELDCEQLVEVLGELGVEGLADGAALANQSFGDEQGLSEDGCCTLQFQPGCR